MRVLILVSSILAAASASWFPLHFNHQHVQSQHVPVIHKGVPVETQAVQQAKLAHFAALAKAIAHPEYQHVEEQEHEHQYAVPQDIHYTYLALPTAHQQHQKPVLYLTKHITPVHETSYITPTIDHNGKPLDTPEVEAAKAKHFAAVQKALSAVTDDGPQIHYHHKRDAHWALERIPVINYHGLAENNAEVKLVKHDQLAPHQNAHSNTLGYSIQQVHYPAYGIQGYHIPKFDHQGFQLDTAEVEHAKSSHTAAHQEANSRFVHGTSNYGTQAHYPVYGTHEYHIPKFDHKGFQLDTAEVKLAKSAHTAAHQEANARLVPHGYASHWGSGSISSHHY